jgi:hypothetical protein
MGLFSPPPPSAQKRGFWGVFWGPRTPFFLCWPRFGQFWTPKSGVQEISRPETANLLASQASFCPALFESRYFHRFEGGGRQLLHFGRSRGPQTAPICRFGTRPAFGTSAGDRAFGREVSILGRSSIFGPRDRPIFDRGLEFAGSAGPISS